jgi:ClpP class serine protease
MDLWNLIWIFFLLASLQPAVQRGLLAQTRRHMLGRISKRRGATAITLIHRQETVSLLGFPLMRYIDIDDAQTVLKAIRQTPPGRGIEIILHSRAALSSRQARSRTRYGITTAA